MDREKQLNLVYLFVAIWGVVLFQSFLGHTTRQVELSYNEFGRYLEQGWLKDLAEKLAPYNVNYKGVITGGPLATLIGWFAALVFFLVWFLLFRKSRLGARVPKGILLVGRPDKAGREQILRVHLKKIQADEAVSIEAIASLTTGFSGAFQIGSSRQHSRVIAQRRTLDLPAFQ